MSIVVLPWPVTALLRGTSSQVQTKNPNEHTATRCVTRDSVDRTTINLKPVQLLFLNIFSVSDILTLGWSPAITISLETWNIIYKAVVNEQKNNTPSDTVATLYIDPTNPYEFSVNLWFYPITATILSSPACLSVKMQTCSMSSSIYPSIHDPTKITAENGDRQFSVIQMYST